MPFPSSPESLYRRILASQRRDEPLCHLADRHGVKRRTLYWWHQRLAKRAAAEGSDPAPPPADLVPVELPPSLLSLGAMTGTPVRGTRQG